MWIRLVFVAFGTWTGSDFDVWCLFWPDIYCVKNKNLHIDSCLFFTFWQKMA
nr:MAG TPA: hypothetical protein [Caudoviricetes sp.]